MPPPGLIPRRLSFSSEILRRLISVCDISLLSPECARRRMLIFFREAIVIRKGALIKSISRHPIILLWFLEKTRFSRFRLRSLRDDTKKDFRTLIMYERIFETAKNSLGTLDVY